LWDFFSAEPIGEMNLNNTKFFILKMSNSGKYFAMGSENGELWLFHVKDFKFIGKSQGHSTQVLFLYKISYYIYHGHQMINK
jgi:hypothetical protein